MLLLLMILKVKQQKKHSYCLIERHDLTWHLIVVGIIPHIRKHAPSTRIIFRSHIEIRADLIRDYPEGPQAETWK
jgi:hypothetical protein